jgi:elongation factor Ts
MAITAAEVKELRDATGAGMMDCKRALEEKDGDFDEAVKYLREKGIAKALKRASKVASEGAVASYIHMGGKIGVLVEVNCETDFVARGEVFQEFVKNLCLQICSASPLVDYKRRSARSPLMKPKKRFISSKPQKQENHRIFVRK